MTTWRWPARLRYSPVHAMGQLELPLAQATQSGSVGWARVMFLDQIRTTRRTERPPVPVDGKLDLFEGQEGSNEASGRDLG